MFSHDAFAFPKLTQKNLPGGRVYEVESTGECYPSITRVLGSKPKPQLTAWKKRVGVLEAQHISQTATTRGTALHTLSEYYLDNRNLSDLLESADTTVQQYWRDLHPWIDANVATVHAQEQDVYSDRLGVAGRLDLLATTDDGALAIIDFKNSRRPKKIQHVQDYFIQGTFYACAVFELTGKKVPKILVPIVSPEGLQVFETTPSQHFAALRERIAFFYNLAPVI